MIEVFSSYSRLWKGVRINIKAQIIILQLQSFGWWDDLSGKSTLLVCDLSSIPGTYIKVEGENQLHKVVLWPTHPHHGMYMSNYSRWCCGKSLWPCPGSLPQTAQAVLRVLKVLVVAEGAGPGVEPWMLPDTDWAHNRCATVTYVYYFL